MPAPPDRRKATAPDRAPGPGDGAHGGRLVESESTTRTTFADGSVQLALLPDTGRARRDDAPTSVEAAKRVNVAARMALVEDELRRGPGTAAQLSSRLAEADVDMPTNVVSRRLTDLERAGRAIRSGTEDGAYGRPVTRWRWCG